MGVYESLDGALARFGRSSIMGPRAYQYICGPVCGVLCVIFFFISLAVSGLLPPIKAYYTPEQMVDYWKERKTGAQWGAALLMISSIFYLPYTASISSQMRRVPNLPYLATALQLAAGAAGIFTFITPAQTLALITFRLDRDPESTQMLTDLFFFFLLTPWPTFLVQDWAWAYAILVDQRPRPIFPKFMALVNILVPCLFLPTLGMHAHLSGAIAYQGFVTFWLIGGVFTMQLLMDSFCLYIAIRADPLEPAVLLSAPGLSYECENERDDEVGNASAPAPDSV